MQHLDDRQHSSTRYQNVQSIDQRIEFVRLVRIHELFGLELATELEEPQHIQDLFDKKLVLPQNVKVSSISQQNLSLLVSFSFVGDDECKEGEDEQQNTQRSVQSTSKIAPDSGTGETHSTG